jgi:hypothetical protein
MRTRPDGDHGGLIVRGYLFIYLRPTEPVIRTRDSSGATMSQMVGARGQVTRGGPRASSGQEAGAAGARDSPRATLSQETEVVVLMLVCRDTRYHCLNACTQGYPVPTAGISCRSTAGCTCTRLSWRTWRRH